MSLVRTSWPSIEAILGSPVEAGCGASPFGTVWPCGCFAMPVKATELDWLSCPEHRAAAAATQTRRLSGLWESGLEL